MASVRGIGRGGHDQLVRHEARGATLLLQGHALLHAEAVLFIDNDQGQFGEIDSLLKQCVCSNDNLNLP